MEFRAQGSGLRLRYGIPGDVWTRCRHGQDAEQCDPDMVHESNCA